VENIRKVVEPNDPSNHPPLMPEGKKKKAIITNKEKKGLGGGV